MAALSPVCHTHYFLFAAPLVVGLWAARPSRGLLAGLLLVAGVNLIVLLPPLRMWRELGVGLLSVSALWGYGLWLCRRP